jgi:nucleoside-diphosphate-sugar epimerase
LIGTTLPKSSNEDPEFDFASNVTGTIQLLRAAKRQGLRKIVFVSSGGKPLATSQYGRYLQRLVEEEQRPPR